MGLNDRLKNARESLGKSQKEMAELLGIGLKSWQVYEQGSSVPGGKVFEALVKLGFNANWLLDGEGLMRLDEAVYPPADGLAGADTAKELPLPFAELPEINQRFLRLPSLLDMDDEGFCRIIEMDPHILSKIKAGHPVPGLVIRAVAYEWGVRTRWLKMGELPFKNPGGVDHLAREMWGAIEMDVLERRAKGEDI